MEVCGTAPGGQAEGGRLHGATQRWRRAPWTWREEPVSIGAKHKGLWFGMELAGVQFGWISQPF